MFQFFVSLPLAVPAALAGNPAVSPTNLPENLWDGWRCFLGYNSVMIGEHPDHCWPGGPLYVTLYLVANVNFNILIILVRLSNACISMPSVYPSISDVCVRLHSRSSQQNAT